jgi:hypothetical protein
LFFPLATSAATRARMKSLAAAFSLMRRSLAGGGGMQRAHRLL